MSYAQEDLLLEAADERCHPRCMTDKITRGIGGWVVFVTTWARGEDASRVSVFDVAEADSKVAAEVVIRASGAPATAVTVKTHLTTAALILMRVKAGEMRMRKSFKPPRDIKQLVERIAKIAAEEADEMPRPTPASKRTRRTANRYR